MKQFQILLLFLFSTLLLPNITMACGMSADKKVDSEISNSSDQQQKSCCKEGSDSEKDHKNCSNTCEQSCCNCATSSASSSFNFTTEASFKNTTHIISYPQKLKSNKMKTKLNYQKAHALPYV